MKTKKIPNSSGSHIKFMVCVFGFVVIFLFAPTIYKLFGFSAENANCLGIVSILPIGLFSMLIFKIWNDGALYAPEWVIISYGTETPSFKTGRKCPLLF
jgi:hypothetical protein